MLSFSAMWTLSPLLTPLCIFTGIGRMTRTPWLLTASSFVGLQHGHYKAISYSFNQACVDCLHGSIV